jgi:hypothetical protein
MPEAFVSAPWMPFAVAFDVIGRTSPSPNWAATFAGTTIRYRPSPAVVSVVEGGLGVLEMSCERCWASGLAASSGMPRKRSRLSGKG